MILQKMFNRLIIFDALVLVGLVATILFVFKQEAPETIEVNIYKIEDEVLQEIESDGSDEKIKQLDIELSNISQIQDVKIWYLAHKRLNDEYEEYGSWDEIYDIYSEEDLRWLFKTVETECHGGSFESKANVCRVILNRVEDERFPNTIKEVVTQPGQFTNHKIKIDSDTVLACEYAFAFLTPAENCLWFHSNSKTETFSGGVYKFTDDIGHHFYELGGEEVE